MHLEPAAGVLALTLTACATIGGTTGEQDATLWLDAPVRLWREPAKDPLTVTEPVVRAGGPLLLEIIGETCRPAIELYAEPGDEYRIAHEGCKVTCSAFQLDESGRETGRACRFTSHESLAAAVHPEPIEKPMSRPFEWAQTLARIIESAGIVVVSSGDRVFVEKVRLAGTGMDAGFREGDELVRTAFKGAGGRAWRYRDIDRTMLANTWAVKDRPVVIIVRRGPRRVRLVLNRSRRQRW